ncbi:hypothetical protein M758_11G097900 [Ceratodon purpureus]|nr:hypothetical protein M758_11G097900 [Ceratodon purpureus]
MLRSSSTALPKRTKCSSTHWEVDCRQTVRIGLGQRRDTETLVRCTRVTTRRGLTANRRVEEPQHTLSHGKLQNSRENYRETMQHILNAHHSFRFRPFNHSG